MSLITLCPHCDTSFRITDEQLAAADGAVRCGACLAVFSAPEHLLEEPQPDLVELPNDADMDTGGVLQVESEIIDEYFDNERPPRRGAQPDETVTVDEVGAEADDAVEQALVSDVDDKGAESEDAENGQTERERESESLAASVDGWGQVAGERRFEAPELVHEDVETGHFNGEFDGGFSGQFDNQSEAQTSIEQWLGDYGTSVRRHYVAFALASVGLVLLLALQFSWFNRDSLAQNPDLRGYYESVCGVLGCTLPVYENLSELHVTHLVVRTHPSVARALAVDAIIRNEAPWRQYFPSLSLRFSNIEGRLIAARTFKPEDYLAGEMTGVKFIPAKTEVRISLAIVDPGKDATNYSLTVVQ